MGRDRGEQLTPDLFSTETVRDSPPSPTGPIAVTQPTAGVSSNRDVLPKNLRKAVKHLSDGELDLLHAATLEERGRRGRLPPTVRPRPRVANGQIFPWGASGAGDGLVDPWAGERPCVLHLKWASNRRGLRNDVRKVLATDEPPIKIGAKGPDVGE